MSENGLSRQIMEHRRVSGAVTNKKRKCGIIYISTLPPHMNVTKIREIFSLYGNIGRVFLQPADTGREGKNKRRKPAKHFTEGWVEFQSKQIAKQVALQLNTTRIGERKKSKFYDYLWNIKYLPRDVILEPPENPRVQVHTVQDDMNSLCPSCLTSQRIFRRLPDDFPLLLQDIYFLGQVRFKWVHLNERLAYERAVHQQRLRTEIAQAKREANIISHNTEKSERLRKRRDKLQDLKSASRLSSFLTQYHQRKTDKEIYHDNGQKSENMAGGVEDRSNFLKNLFGSDT